MENEDIKTLVPISTTRIVRLNNSIEITNKILFQKVESIFNQAFKMINSINEEEKTNYLYLLSTDKEYRLRTNFSFIAKSKSDYKKVIILLSEVLTLLPKNNVAYNIRGIAKLRTNDFLGAIEDFNQIIEIDPNYFSAFNNRGIVKEQLKDFQGAIEDYNRAIEIDPNNSFAYKNRGLARKEVDDLEGFNQDMRMYEKLKDDD